MNNLVANRTQLVKAVITSVPSNGAEFKFNQVPNISKNNIRVYGISGYTNSQLTTGPDGEDVIPTFTGIVLTLVTHGNDEKIYHLPLVDVIRQENSGFFFLLDYLQLTVTECYITITNAAGLSVGEVALFNLHYEFIED